MKKKKYIGKLISVKFTDRKTPIYGYVVDYNNDWTLMKSNPIDFIIDGYIIFKHKNIKGFRRDIEEKWREKVLNLKGLQVTEKDIIPLTDLETILAYLTNSFGIFQIYTKSETACYLGRLKSIDKKEFVMDTLNSKGKWKGQMKFRNEDIRIIEFDTDYINSLKLVLATKKTKK
ncbi:hypothetical protein [Pedobacter psychrodurus]|uniref:hypothetical protein n=1 Tax=Pedobacter psychrodurus TaxID=2530456 RepID=UPI00292D1C92|nr:hypothetical protein [Pedobacter psychrodurus]